MLNKSSISLDLKSTSPTKSFNDDIEIQTIEKHIQNILNMLIKGLQLLETNETVFDKFQTVFYKSESLEEYLSGLYEMLKKLISEVDLKVVNKKNVVLHQDLNKKESIHEKDQTLSCVNYENLEKVLQKYEAEIREHIRIEQQLKIYSDGLEEKITDREKEVEMEMQRMNLRIKELEDDNQKMGQLVEEMKLQQRYGEENGKKKKGVSIFESKEGREISLKKVLFFDKTKNFILLINRKEKKGKV
jgi:CRISPR/Cas system-associated endonuclease Cas3-HD